jgi:hypothetical protein
MRALSGTLAAVNYGVSLFIAFHATVCNCFIGNQRGTRKHSYCTTICDQPHGKDPFLRRKLLYCVEPQGSVMSLTGFYPTLDETSLQSHIQFIKHPF